MKDGIYRELTIEDYHANTTHISASAIKLVRKSLKHYLHYYGTEEDRASHFDFGNAFETVLLSPDTADDSIHVFDEDARPEPDKTFNSKLNKAWRDEQYKLDKYIIKKNGKESLEIIEKMVESCYKDAVIQRLVKNVDYQLSCFWTDKETKLKLKTRPDICKLKKNVVVDVKTAEDASPDGFSRAAARFDYPIQAAMQIDGVLSSGLMNTVDEYYWLVVEKGEPFNAQLYLFQSEDREWATDTYRFYLSMIARARKEKKYPGYGQWADNKWGILPLRLPLWYRSPIYE